MPWNETNRVEQRLQFVKAWRSGELPMSALCNAFGVTRPTGYKWVSRYFEDGNNGELFLLQDRSRAPFRRPHATNPLVEDLLIRARKSRPQYGPRKLRVWLTELGHRRLPAPSTIGEILTRHGLTRSRKFRRRTPPSTQPFAQCNSANAIWCVDFKGHFRTRDRTRIYPLTIMDAHTRYLLRCEGLVEPNGKNSQEVFESAFREFGLPAAIRSDNGPPFASTGVGGLSALSIWWIRLGITPERIEPGKPQQNGRHERMHLTLKQETATPPADDFISQQRSFDRFRKRYNEERPHEALGQVPPARVYQPSSRVFSEPRRSGAIDYDTEQALVDRDGFIRFGKRRFFIGSALAHELVDLHPVRDRCWQVNFGPVLLGLLDEDNKRPDLIRPKPRRSRKVETMSPV